MRKTTIEEKRGATTAAPMSPENAADLIELPSMSRRVCIA
jgi:hypothetical protein